MAQPVRRGGDTMKIRDRYIAVKRRNAPETFDFSEGKALVARVAGQAYADAVHFEQCESDGFDCFEVSDRDGGILIRASSGSGFAAGFNAYLKERCGYSVGALTTSGTLPAAPPAVGEPIRRKSRFLYRNFFNYCTFSYTYVFDDWTDWEKTLDYLLLSGYNLILNPIGIECVWRDTLESIGYEQKEIDRFICGPAFYTWQWGIRLSGWAGGAPESWYDMRRELAGRINLRLRAFGVSVVAPGYAGMVPDDFVGHFPTSRPVPQGRWCEFVRPSLLLPDDPNFDRIADAYYAAYKRLPGARDTHYYSADPFIEGGITEGIKLGDLGRGVFAKMTQADPDAVWVLLGWTNTPKPQMLESIPDDRVLVLNLSGDSHFSGEQYGGAPWCYCAVYSFGGQYYYAGDAEKIASNPFHCLDDDHTNVVGMGYMPESVNCNEIICEIVSWCAFADEGGLDRFLPYYLSTRYGKGSEKLLPAWRTLCREAMDGQGRISGESALCARPTLTVRNTSTWAKEPNPNMDQSAIADFLEAMLGAYDEFGNNAAFRRDLMEAARQAVANLSWHYADRIQHAYAEKKPDELSEYGRRMLSLFDLQTAIVSTHGDMLLGKWLEKAKRHGHTPAEKAYFEYNARLQITLWGDREAAALLRDYAAREWQGMLEDFYRPRWESFISRLEISLLTDTPLEEIRHYDEELPFVYRKKEYPVTPSGDLRQAAAAALREIRSAGVVFQEAQAQSDFEENVLRTIQS